MTSITGNIYEIMQIFDSKYFAITREKSTLHKCTKMCYRTREFKRSLMLLSWWDLKIKIYEFM
jgi:hypothetical protein